MCVYQYVCMLLYFIDEWQNVFCCTCMPSAVTGVSCLDRLIIRYCNYYCILIKIFLIYCAYNNAIHTHTHTHARAEIGDCLTSNCSLVVE